MNVSVGCGFVRDGLSKCYATAAMSAHLRADAQWPFRSIGDWKISTLIWIKRPTTEGCHLSFLFPGERIMKPLIVLAVTALVFVSTSAADATGCIKGAVAGGIAGHYAGHGVVGAAAGCYYARHRANQQARQQHGHPQNPSNAQGKM
jgi:hypothetical protein